MLFYKTQETHEFTNVLSMLYEKHRTLMLRVALNILRDRYLAEDAVQEAFVRAAKYPERLLKADETVVKQFLVMLAKNAAIDIYRKRSRQMKKEVYVDELEENENLAAEMEAENRVLEVLKNLPVKYRDVFLLKYTSGLANSEIAEILRISEKAVNQRVTRGKVMVRQALEEIGEW